MIKVNVLQNDFKQRKFEKGNVNWVKAQKIIIVCHYLKHIVFVYTYDSDYILWVSNAEKWVHLLFLANIST